MRAAISISWGTAAPIKSGAPCAGEMPARGRSRFGGEGPAIPGRMRSAETTNVPGLSSLVQGRKQGSF